MSDETKNYIRKVAVIGGTGQVGGRILSSLLATGKKHSITAITRQESKSTFPASVNVAKADYSSQESLTDALHGHDFLFISLSVAAPPDLHGRIVDAAVAAGIKWIMPNYFGYALTERDPKAFDDQIFTSFENPIKDVLKHQGEGVNFVALCCGFWYEFSLAFWAMTYGFDFKEKKVTFYDDGKYKINTSTWELCGEAVAQLLSLPIQSEGGQPAVSDWANKGLYVSSFLISQRDMLDSVNRVIATSDADWKIEYQGAKERYEEGVKEMMGGQRSGFAKAMYASTFIPNGRGDYQTGWTLDHEKLGLKDEDLDTATKRAVDMVNAGFGPSSYS